MRRITAFLIVAFIGFILGILLYILGIFIIPYILEKLPEIAGFVNEYRHVIGALLSGLLGSIIAVVIAYYWASREYSF